MSELRCECANCGATLAGRFCSSCGQSAAEPPYSLGVFLASSVSDVLNLRSRTLRSLLDLVIRPGEVTAAYLAGRRARYTQPVQLYLIAAALFFLANSFHPFVAITEDNWVVSSLGAVRAGKILSEEELRVLEGGGVSTEVFRERFQSTVSQSLPPFMIGSILIFALMLGAFSPKRPALMHTVFSLNWTGFYLFIMALERLVPGRPGSTSVLGPVLVAAALVHLVIALHVAYGHSWVRSAVSGFGLTVLFNIILMGWVRAVVEYAQWQAG